MKKVRIGSVGLGRLGLRHAENIAGKHVFCEKPLGVTVAECREAVEARPDLVFMLGFMRRFDQSYQYAHEKVAAGKIGRPVLFRSHSQDRKRCALLAAAISMRNLRNTGTGTMCPV
jgi:hypothetical protein